MYVSYNIYTYTLRTKGITQAIGILCQCAHVLLRESFCVLRWWGGGAELFGYAEDVCVLFYHIKHQKKNICVGGSIVKEVIYCLGYSPFSLSLRQR